MKNRILFIVIAALVFVWACDGPGGNGCDPDPPVTGITVTGPIGSDVGKGAPWFTAWEDLSKRGYVEEEFFFESDATSYALEGEMTSDGLWTVSEADKAHYKSRLLIRRPVDPAKFNGTVVVEWFNVSGGVDAAPGWMFNEPFLTREGYIWVGVSAQKVGVAGGFSMLGNIVQPLVDWDPERYGSLVHPGDAYSYDIYTQAAKVLKGLGSKEVLGGMKAARLLAYGESQSAFTMITYTNALQPVAKVFDGIFIHSRASLAVPLEGQAAGGCSSFTNAPAVRVRTDLDVPVFQFETEGDVTGFYEARQPDTDRIRTWEIAGTAHADHYLISRITEAELEDAVPEQASMFSCPDANKGPQYIVLRAALKGLDRWVKDGIAPPNAAPLEMDGNQVLRDEHGNARGGVRTPHVDVPIAKYTPTGKVGGGDATGGCNAMSMMCVMFGGTEPFPEDKLTELYPTHADYVSKYTASTQACVAERFMLAEEAAAIIAEAQAAAIPN